MGNRLVRWFTYSVVFALIPIVSSVVFRFFAGKLSVDTISRSPELLFFSLMINATALGDLSDVIQRRQKDLTVGLFRSAVLIGAISSAILYGGFVLETVTQAVGQSFARSVFATSIFLGIASFALGVVVQIFLGRIKQKR